MLENYDENGNRKYGLIDAGTNSDHDYDITAFLKNHGVITEAQKKEGEEGCCELEFFLITHYHQDHADKAWAILERYNIKTLYIKEYDYAYAGQNVQDRYESIIKNALEGVKTGRIEKIVGISPQSLKSDIISPSRTSNFKTNIAQNNEAINTNFEGFNDSNTVFSFGSAQMKIFNWEMYYKDGTKYRSGTNPTKERLRINNENSNSLGLLLVQGNKRAFFAGDLNNQDDGIGGYEDRLKNSIGEVDFFKLNHHGYENSNTDSFLNTLKPKFAVVTTDIGEMDKNTENWLNNNKVKYLYTTLDEECVSATITDTDVYLGFHDTNCFKKINDDIYYIPEGKQYCDYTKECYKIVYDIDASPYKSQEVNSFEELKTVIENDSQKSVLESNNGKYIKNDLTKTINIRPLEILLKNSGNLSWNVEESIVIKENQIIKLNTTEEITISRGDEFTKFPIFEVNGALDLGESGMVGSITLDGNEIEASSTLIKVERGYLRLHDKVKLCNSINKTTGKTLHSVVSEKYTSFGSAIYSILGTIDMNGGEISNNIQYVNITLTLPKSTNTYYNCDAIGAGICLSNHSKLNMNGGVIKNNKAVNNSIVQTNEEYTHMSNRGITQSVKGVGVYAERSEIELSGNGKICNNIAINNSRTELVKPSQDGKITDIYSISAGASGIGIFFDSSKLLTDGSFEISDNNATVESEISLAENTKITSNSYSLIRGLQGYVLDTIVDINKLKIDGNNSSFENNSTINKNSTATYKAIDKSNNGGGLAFAKCYEINIKNLTINNCNSDHGGALWLKSCSGMIDNSYFGTNSDEKNTSTERGGALYLESSNINIKDSNFYLNSSKYGGAIYSNSSSTVLDGVSVSNNTSTGSGGGIYCLGSKMIITGNSRISGNTAGTFGGGIAINSSDVYFNGGTIESNIASSYGYGVGIYKGYLIQNDGTINNGIGINTDNNSKFIRYGGTFLSKVGKSNGTQIVNPDGTYYIDKTNYLGKEFLKIEVTKSPSKTIYIEGENFDKKGMKVIATYSDGSTKEVNGFTVTDENNLSIGKKTVTISYTENGMTNTTTQSITVKEKLKINFNDYIEVYDEENKYIKNIIPSTTLQEMIDNVTTNGNVTIYKNDEINTDNNEKMSTGMKVKIFFNDQSCLYTIAVKGDTNGDGEADLKDLLLINKHRLNKALLVDEFLLAGDVNQDNKVDLKDLLQINKYRLGKIQTL